MKNINDIYAQIIEPLKPYVPNDKKPTKKQRDRFDDRLIMLILGMVVGSELVGDKIQDLAKQIKSLIK